MLSPSLPRPPTMSAAVTRGGDWGRASPTPIPRAAATGGRGGTERRKGGGGGGRRTAGLHPRLGHDSVEDVALVVELGARLGLAALASAECEEVGARLGAGVGEEFKENALRHTLAHGDVHERKVVAGRLHVLLQLLARAPHVHEAVRPPHEVVDVGSPLLQLLHAPNVVPAVVIHEWRQLVVPRVAAELLGRAVSAGPRTGGCRPGMAPTFCFFCRKRSQSASSMPLVSYVTCS